MSSGTEAKLVEGWLRTHHHSPTRTPREAQQHAADGGEDAEHQGLGQHGATQLAGLGTVGGGEGQRAPLA